MNKINYPLVRYPKGRLTKEEAREYHKLQSTLLFGGKKLGYRMTAAEYQLREYLQDKKCAICGQEETSTHKTTVRRLAVDHNHKTGEVRQLLCHRCNHLLGLAKDDIELFQKIIPYLEKTYTYESIR